MGASDDTGDDSKTDAQDNAADVTDEPQKAIPEEGDEPEEQDS
jgi:hypothetical protein